MDRTPPTEVWQGARSIWLETFLYPPSTLYHYTSVDAVLAILRSRKMWATDLRYTNDRTDLTHGETIINSTLDEAIANCAFDSICEWLDAFRETIHTRIEKNSWYSISFCTDGDLLSQWRGYGSRGGGIALGWGALSSYSDVRLLAGITYDHELQRSVARKIVDYHVAYLADETKHKAGPQGLTQTAADSLVYYFSLFLSTFKHSSFAEEAEFRWLFRSSDGDDSIPPPVSVNFGKFGSIVKPYVEVDVSLAQLVSVVYGPTADDLTPRWLRALLDAHGYATTEIVPSTVPLRAV